jgi:diamine N-acetyltransferase
MDKKDKGLLKSTYVFIHFHQRQNRGRNRVRIIEIRKNKDIRKVLPVINNSFKTVADDFGLTKENAPTTPAFITIDQLHDYMKKDLVLYGLVKKDAVIGCVAVEKAQDKDNTYFIERLAVLPGERHKGYGKKLLDHAVRMIKEHDGKHADIGIINAHTVLKQWYINYGFKEIGTKNFKHLPFEVCFLSMDITE